MQLSIDSLSAVLWKTDNCSTIMWHHIKAELIQVYRNNNSRDFSFPYVIVQKQDEAKRMLEIDPVDPSEQHFNVRSTNVYRTPFPIKRPTVKNLCFSLGRWSSVSPLSLGVIHIVSLPSVCLCCLATCLIFYIPPETTYVRSVPWKDPAFVDRLTPAPVSSCLRM